MSTEDQEPGSGTNAPAATQGARAIGDILAALAARLPGCPPTERRAAPEDRPQE